MKNKKFKQIIADGVALLVPVLAALYLLNKLYADFRKILAPVAEKLGIEHFFGRFTLTLLAILAIFLLVLVLGLMMGLPIVANFRKSAESILLRIFPPLNQLKVMITAVLNRADATQYWKAVLLEEGNKYLFAFLIEETELMGVFFVMKGDSIHRGDIEMLKKDSYSYTEVDAIDMIKSMNQFGANATGLIRKNTKPI